MSKAFVKDDAAQDTEVDFEPVDLGPTCYITPTGMARLKEDLNALYSLINEAQDHPLPTSLKKRIQYLESLVAKAEIIDPVHQSGEKVRFGATVTVRAEDEQIKTYKIVGIYEADTKAGNVSYLSPIAKALLGTEVGDVALIETPQTEEELEILKIDYI